MGISSLSRETRRAVFLDRDGVLNRTLVRNGKPLPPASVGELEILPLVLESLQDLKQAGFVLVVATNQPDVGRRTQSREVVEAIHARLRSDLPLDHIMVCYHTDFDACACRKPRPGLLLEAARHYALDLKSSFMVGDRWRDIDAGHNAGCRSILINYEYDEQSPQERPFAVLNSLRDAADLILSLEQK